MNQLLHFCRITQVDYARSSFPVVIRMDSEAKSIIKI